MISHTAANSVKVVAEGLAGDHGETDERPMPLPSATRSKVLATAVSAPPITAAQETADGEAGPSSDYRYRAKRRCWECHAAFLSPDEREQDDDRDRHAKQPEQYATTHFRSSKVCPTRP